MPPQMPALPYALLEHAYDIKHVPIAVSLLSMHKPYIK